MHLIVTALAEETASVSGNSLNILVLCLIGLGFYYLICGILTLLKKKIYDGTAKSYAQYTDESVQKAIPFIGLMDILLGTGFLFFDAFQYNLIPTANATAIKWIGAGVFLATAIAVGCYMQFRILKKKPAENQ